MIVNKIPDGGYTWALPNGTWASLINAPNAASDGPEFVRVDSDRGAIALPWPQNAPVGMKPRLDGQRFSGQNYTGGRALTYDFESAAWLPEGPIVGRFDCIYTLDGKLVTTPPKYPDGSIDVNGNRYVALDGTTAGKIVGGDATYGPTAKAPKLSGWTDVSRDGDTFIVGQGHEQGGVHYFDGTDWRWIAHGPCHAIWTWRDGDIVAVAFYRDLGGWRTEAEVWIGSVVEFQALDLVQPLPPPPPPKPDTFGPIGDPLPDGTSITMSPYVFAATDFHRDGDHGMAQVTRPEGYYLMKFGHGDAYELWAEDAWGIHHLEDASAFDMNTTYHFTDTRWCRAEMKVGRADAYQAPPHEIVEFHRDTKAEFNRWGYTREMWLWRAWEKFDCGPHLGVHPVVVMVYDPTGGAHTPPDVMDPKQMRGIELFYFALGFGWIAWEYHHSGRVYQTGSAEFNDYTRLARTDFYFNGATPIAPKPTGCATTPTQVPEVPPMSERNLTTAERATIDAFGANFPPPQYPGPGDAPESWQDANLRHAPNGWVYKLAQQMAFSHGSGWGQKRRGPGANISNGTIALKDTGTNFHAYDLLESASTGRPKLLGGNGSYYYVDDGQEWLSVPPFNHLGDQKPRPGRAPWPSAVRHGVSGFDVAPRLQGGDASYYNLTAPLPLNCFVYTTIIHPETHRLGRTFVEGLAQTETLLKRLTADGRKAMFIMICGPHTANNGPKPTRAEILDMVRQQVALFVRYPKAVLALSLGNELYQGFEPPELLDPTLWAEVDQLVPLEFPFCVGQVSEAVVFGPGSFAAMHPDRGKSSADALQILADAQAHDGRIVVAREPARIEAGGTGQARGDIAFVREELDNSKRLKIPYFLHLKTGRGCYTPSMDDVEHQALALIKAEAAVVTPPGPPVPPITPPGSGHPVLDVNLRSGNPQFLSHAGYNLFVFHRKDVEAEAEKWYRKATGHAPADSDLAVMVYVRGVAERDVWGTLREAWKNGLPNGEP